MLTPLLRTPEGTAVLSIWG